MKWMMRLYIRTWSIPVFCKGYDYASFNLFYVISSILYWFVEIGTLIILYEAQHY